MIDVSQVVQMQGRQSVPVDELQRRFSSLDGNPNIRARGDICPEEKAGIVNAAREFEAYFLQMMLREMRRTIPQQEEGMFAKSTAEEIFTDKLDEQRARDMAAAGGIGLADMMVMQMTMGYSNRIPRM
jgi:flagellar protein FlgJ